MKKIPFLDLSKVHSEIQNVIDKSVFKVLNSGSYILGKELSEFENTYSEFENVKHA